METLTQQNRRPALRFPQYDDDWRTATLGDVTSCITSGSRDWAQYYADEGDLFLRMTNLRKDNTVDLNLEQLKYVALPETGAEQSRTSVLPGDILVSITAELGRIGLVPEGLGRAYINQHTALLRPDADMVVSRFLAQTLATSRTNRRLNRLNDAGAKAGLNLRTLGRFQCVVPSLEEQQKIADFLGSVDAWLDNLRKQKTALETYKRGMMQKLFRQEVWFKDEDGKEYPEWTHVRFGDVFKRVATKNKGEHCKRVLTISGAQGLVAQLEYYNHSYASKDLSGYTHIKRDEFAYNKSYSSGYPMGAIKRLVRHDEGVVSPLYICFRKQPTRKDVLAFLEYYFESGLFNRQIVKIAQEGARSHGLLNLSVSDLFDDTLLLLPNAAEQHKIADFLTSLDQTITAKADEIAKVEQWKKGLTQKMFV